jgi:hypothetical protein
MLFRWILINHLSLATHLFQLSILLFFFWLSWMYHCIILWTLHQMHRSKDQVHRSSQCCTKCNKEVVHGLSAMENLSLCQKHQCTNWWLHICFWYWWMLKFTIYSRLLLSNYITKSWKYKWSSIICDVSFHWKHFPFHHNVGAFGGYGSSILPQPITHKVFELPQTSIQVAITPKTICHCSKNTNVETWWPCIYFWYWWVWKFTINSRLLLSNWTFALCSTTSWKYIWSSIICDVSFHWKHF